MNTEILKEIVALVGGLLSAILLFLQALGVELSWFNDHTIETFVGALTASIPLVVVIYGVCKNTKLFNMKEDEK